MITFPRGRLVTSLPDRACLDVGGVGYEVGEPLARGNGVQGDPWMGAIGRLMEMLR